MGEKEMKTLGLSRGLLWPFWTGQDSLMVRSLASLRLSLASLSMKGGYWTRSVVLTLWSLDQKHQHHWEIARHVNSQTPSQTYWIWNSEEGTLVICFNEPSTLVWCTLNSENCWTGGPFGLRSDCPLFACKPRPWQWSAVGFLERGLRGGERAFAALTSLPSEGFDASFASLLSLSVLWWQELMKMGDFPRACFRGPGEEF